MKTNMTKHARFDRAQRIEKIIDIIGIGDIVVKCEADDDADKEICLTSTGICIVRKKSNYKIITVYVASARKALTIYQKAYGYKNVPHGMLEIIRANRKYAEIINNADYA